MRMMKRSRVVPTGRASLVWSIRGFASEMAGWERDTKLLGAGRIVNAGPVQSVAGPTENRGTTGNLNSITGA